MINHTYQCVFVPVCQTGAFRVIHEFYPFYWEDKENNQDAFFLNWGARYGLNYTVDVWKGHEDDLDTWNDSYSNYFTFTLVRCPQDRFISGWKYDKTQRLRDFDDLLFNLPQKREDFDEAALYTNHPYRMITKTQFDCIDSNHLIGDPFTAGFIDYVMRFETLQRDFDKVCDIIGKPRSKIEDISVWTDCLPVYNCDRVKYFLSHPSSEYRKQLSSSFSVDFKKFGYVTGCELFPSANNLQAYYNLNNNPSNSYANNLHLTEYSSSNLQEKYLSAYGISGYYLRPLYNQAYLRGEDNAMDFNDKSYTISFWFNPTYSSDQVDANGQTLVDWGSNGGIPIRLCDNEQGGVDLQANLYDGTDWNSVYITSSFGKDGRYKRLFDQETWNHVAVTFDSSSLKLKMYLNYYMTSSITTGGQVFADSTPVFSIGRESWGYQSDCNIDEVAVWYRCLNDNEVKVLYNNGDGNFLDPVYNIIRPDSDVTVTNATGKPVNTSNNRYQNIDEVKPSGGDSDYIYLANNDATATYECGLSNPTYTPTIKYDIYTNLPHVVKFRYFRCNNGNLVSDSSGTGVTLTVGLYQGTTLIASTSVETNNLASWKNGSFVLTETEATNITNYSDLRLRFTQNAVTDRGAAISWAELQLPPA